ncbi:MAG: S8 family peptidase [Myxococcota bacterium]|nr:S8 family peptidase [Myxococcota bacterium]
MLFFLTSMISAAPLVIDFQDGLSKAAIQKEFNLEIEWVHPLSSDEALAYPKAELTESQIALLNTSPLVEAVEESIRVEAFDAPNDPLYEKQWNFEKIDASYGWDAGAGQGVTVAVIDTGVAPVKDFAPDVILEGVSFVSNEKTATDQNGHGTHVAGTIAQYTNNQYGTSGIAHQANILPIKVLSKNGFGQSEWVAAGIDEAVDRGADILNLSLGGTPSKIIEIATRKALDKGVIVVAAAGNTGRKGVSSPARIEGVIAVSATGPNDTLAPYSSWGKEIFISAPGGDKTIQDGGILQETILPNQDTHDFLPFQGTSMATPHVAGAAAVLLGAGASNADNVKEILQHSATDLGPTAHDPKYGHGRLDIKAAVQRLMLTQHGLSFFLTSLFAFGLASFSRMRLSPVFALSAGSLAGGFFFLPLLGFSAPWWLMKTSSWTDGHAFADGLWESSLIPLLAVFLTLGYRKIRPLGILIGAAWSAQILFQSVLYSESSGLGTWLQFGLSFVLTIFAAMVHRQDKKTPLS